MNPCHIFLLDDHKIIRDGIRSILQGQSHYKVSGEEGSPSRFFEDLPRLNIDILLLDLSFAQMTGFQILARVKKSFPKIKVMILSMHNDPEYMQRCSLMGAEGYLTKDTDSHEFLKALEQLRKGGTYFQNRATPLPKVRNKSEVLSEREQEVLILLSNGFSSKQIGGELGISTRTVETHRLNIMKKLGTTNTAELISVAAKLNLI